MLTTKIRNNWCFLFLGGSHHTEGYDRRHLKKQENWYNNFVATLKLGSRRRIVTILPFDIVKFVQWHT